MGNACNSRVKVSLADHDELLFCDFIVKFKHDPDVKDDLRDHIRFSLSTNSKILVAGNPAALAQVFTCYRDLENIDEEPNITQKTVPGDLHGQSFSFAYSETNVALTIHTSCPGRGFLISPTMSQESQSTLFQHFYALQRPSVVNQGLGWLTFLICHSYSARRLVSIRSFEDDVKAISERGGSRKLPDNWNSKYNRTQMESEDPLLLICECCGLRRWPQEDMNQCHWCEYVTVGPCCVASAKLGNHTDPMGVQNVTCDMCQRYHDDEHHSSSNWADQTPPYASNVHRKLLQRGRRWWYFSDTQHGSGQHVKSDHEHKEDVTNSEIIATRQCRCHCCGELTDPERTEICMWWTSGPATPGRRCGHLMCPTCLEARGRNFCGCLWNHNNNVAPPGTGCQVSSPPETEMPNTIRVKIDKPSPLRTSRTRARSVDSLPDKDQDVQRLVPWWVYPKVVQKLVWRRQEASDVKVGEYVWRRQETTNVNMDDQEDASSLTVNIEGWSYPGHSRNSANLLSLRCTRRHLCRKWELLMQKLLGEESTSMTGHDDSKVREAYSAQLRAGKPHRQIWRKWLRLIKNLREAGHVLAVYEWRLSKGAWVYYCLQPHLQWTPKSRAKRRRMWKAVFSEPYGEKTQHPPNVKQAPACSSCSLGGIELHDVSIANRAEKRALKKKRLRLKRQSALDFVDTDEEVGVNPSTGGTAEALWAPTHVGDEQAALNPTLYICEFCYKPALVPYPWCGICQAWPAWHHFGCCLEQWPLYENDGAVMALLSVPNT